MFKFLNNFICDEIFEKAFEFNFTVEEVDKNYYANIKIKNEEFEIHYEKSRIFEFIMKENSEKRFIYSSHHLLDVFHDLDIKCNILHKIYKNNGNLF